MGVIRFNTRKIDNNHFSENVQFQYSFLKYDDVFFDDVYRWASKKFGPQRWEKSNFDDYGLNYQNISDRWGILFDGNRCTFGFVNEEDYMEFMLTWA